MKLDDLLVLFPIRELADLPYNSRVPLRSSSRICHRHNRFEICDDNHDSFRYDCLHCLLLPVRFLSNSLMHAIPHLNVLFLLYRLNHPNYVVILIVLRLLLRFPLRPFLFDLSIKSFCIEPTSVYSSLLFPPLLPLLLIQVLLLVPSPKK